MADIDDELLALAGGDSDSEGSVRESRDRSVSPPLKKKAQEKKNAGRRTTRDESEEEGEASSPPSSPNSLESAPMEESDSEDESSRSKAPAPDDENQYPVDGMFKSEAEKAEIMAMREMEREQILFDRAQETKRQRQNRLLRQMINVEEENKSKKKRPADDDELDDSQRKTSRQRTTRGGETAMDSLRRARAEKQKRREDKERRRDAFSPDRDDFSDRDASGDEYARRRSRTPEEKAEQNLPPAELRDYDRVRLGRNEFAQVCLTPGFEPAITGCFMRVALGPHPETGFEQYRMAQIKGFTTSRPYALQGPNGTFVTDLYARAAHGKAVKEFPFIAASSGKFTENELHRYQVTCHNDGVKLPTKALLTDKIEAINDLINHKWTNEEIKARLAKKNDMRRRFDPAERERIARLLEEATVAEDKAKMEELQEQLDQLGSQRLAFKTSLGVNKAFETPRSSAEQDRLAERNRENRRLNAEAVRRAQLKERAKAREVEIALQRGQQVAEDPSRRLRTKAKFVHDVNESAENMVQDITKAASAPTNGTALKADVAKVKTLPSHLAKLQGSNANGKGLPMIHKPLMDDDVIGSLDMDIEVEI